MKLTDADRDALKTAARDPDRVCLRPVGHQRRDGEGAREGADPAGLRHIRAGYGSAWVRPIGYRRTRPDASDHRRRPARNRHRAAGGACRGNEVVRRLRQAIHQSKARGPAGRFVLRACRMLREQSNRPAIHGSVSPSQPPNDGGNDDRGTEDVQEDQRASSPMVDASGLSRRGEPWRLERRFPRAKASSSGRAGTAALSASCRPSPQTCAATSTAPSFSARAWTQSRPAGDGGNEADGGEEVAGGLVVLGCDAAEVVMPVEHPLDDVAQLVALGVMRDGELARRSAGDDRSGAALGEEMSQVLAR
jgi:hypothetical protein